MQKESFILHNSFYEPIKSLKNEQLGKLLRSIFNYTINGEIPQDSDILIAFMFIKNQIDLDSQKWEEEKKKRSEAGKKGMASRWNKDNNNDNNVITNYNNDNNVKNVITNISDNVNVNVNDNVNVIKKGKYKKEKIYFEVKELDELFKDFLNVRTKIKAINSDRAINSLLKILNDYDDETKYKMIEQSIINSWKSIYPLNKKNKITINTTEWLNEDVKEDKATKEEIERFKKQLEG